MKLLTLLQILIVFAASSNSVLAKETESPSSSANSSTLVTEDLSIKRVVPNYDGLPHSSNAGDALIWIPRIGLFPLYLVTEYLIRAPFGFLITQAEFNHWPTLLLDFFSFGKDRNVLLVPTFLLDFGFQASA